MLGYVGSGLFDVNVPGQLFTSPPPAALAAGVLRADRGLGVLVCVSNHSGDVLNAELAVEMVGDVSGPACRMVVLGDDIGGLARGGQGSRRGGAGLFFVWKMVGAAAEQRYDLESCERLAQRVAAGTRSISATIAGTTNPVTGQPTVTVPAGRVLIGSGVHGDSTGDYLSWQSAREIAAHMVGLLVADLQLRAGSECFTMVNDAGAMSVAETALIHRAAVHDLQRREIRVVGSWQGRYATTLATAGFAIAVCKADAELAKLWLAPCRAPGLNSWGDGPVG
jgi:dihydroxyacetone kinase